MVLRDVDVCLAHGRCKVGLGTCATAGKHLYFVAVDVVSELVRVDVVLPTSVETPWGQQRSRESFG